MQTNNIDLSIFILVVEAKLECALVTIINASIELNCAFVIVKATILPTYIVIYPEFARNLSGIYPEFTSNFPVD